MKPMRETDWRGRRALLGALAVFGVLFTAMSGSVVVTLFGDSIRLELMGGGCLGAAPVGAPRPSPPIVRKSLRNFADEYDDGDR